jgi:hypothetical protein
MLDTTSIFRCHGVVERTWGESSFAASNPGLNATGDNRHDLNPATSIKDEKEKEG